MVVTTYSGVPDALTDARYQDIIRLVIQGHRITAIAGAIGLSERQTRAILREPRFVYLYEVAKKNLWGDIDPLIVDERADTVARQKALQRRSITLLGEAIAASRLTLTDDNGKPLRGVRAGHLRAAVEATRLAHEMATPPGATKDTNVNVNLTVTRDTARVIRSTMEEADIDMSDLVSEAIEVPDASASD